MIEVNIELINQVTGKYSKERYVKYLCCCIYNLFMLYTPFLLYLQFVYVVYNISFVFIIFLCYAHHFRCIYNLCVLSTIFLILCTKSTVVYVINASFTQQDTNNQGRLNRRYHKWW